MYFDYFDMLSGDPLYLEGVGHLRSPRVRELKPANGMGYRAYNFYLNILSWDKERFLKYDQLMQYRGVEKLSRQRFSAFDVVTLLPQTRELCCAALSFFMTENLVWEDRSRRYVSVDPIDNATICGEINRDNFDKVRNIMLQFNFIGLDNDASPAAVYTSDKAKELWEKAQACLKAQADAGESANRPEYHLSNIVSKVCSIHPTYNLLNVYELTVFQLYDAFFQVSYMRSIDLSEKIFSNHGGERFHFEDWLKPIIKNL